MHYVGIRFLWSAAIYVMAALSCSQAIAQSGVYSDMAESWLRKALPAQQGAETATLRMEVIVGNLDSRLRLAPCGNVEPYLPVGMRLWGKTQVGLRCVDGVSRWNVMLPVTVNAFGPAWVVKGQVPAGAVLSVSDVVSSEVNWAEDTNPVLRDRGDEEIHVARYALETVAAPLPDDFPRARDEIDLLGAKPVQPDQPP